MSTKFSMVSLVGAAVELRKSRRYVLRAPASFTWERLDGQLQEGTGTILNISDRGVFIAGEDVPAIGARLDVDVSLPSLEVGSLGMQLHGEGTVVRVVQLGESGKGFAAAVAFQTEAPSGPIIVIPKKRMH